jgi:hypothetical protein
LHANTERRDQHLWTLQKHATKSSLFSERFPHVFAFSDDPSGSSDALQ